MAQKKRIVIAEDDVVSIEMLHHKLTKSGYEVHLTRDGRSGLQAITEIKPDLAIIDMLLPRLHGLDVCRRARRNPETMHIPLLLVSGVYRDERSREEALKAGGNGFYTKPFDMKAILGHIERLLHQQGDQDEVSEAKSTQNSGFRDLLWGRLAEIENMWARIGRERDNDQLLGDLKNKAHGLSGAGAVFGFPEMGRWAETLARDLLLHQESNAALNDEVRARISAHIAQLRRSAAREYGSDVQTKSRSDKAPGETTRRQVVAVIDSNMVLANELSLQLELFGYKVEVYSDLKDYQASENATPDAVIQTYQNPQNAQDFIKDAPVVYIGDEDNLEVRLDAMRAGGKAFFTRPVPMEELMMQLETLTRPATPILYRILVVEPNSVMAEYINDNLRKAGMLVRSIADPMQIMGPLYDFSPDLILIDAHLPGCTGVELTRLIRQHSNYAAVPIVFMTYGRDQAPQDEIMEVGGDDLMLKPLVADQLVTVVRRRARRFRELRALMAKDSLTGLFSYETVKDHFFTEIERAKRLKTPCTLGLIDMDHLSRLNNRLGHAAGDAAMRNLSLILSQRLRGSDHLGRFEGAGLLVVLTNTDAVRALQVLDEIRRDFNRLNIKSGRNAFHASFSCGLASYPKCRKAKTMIKAAEEALGRAKKLGRNRVEISG